MQHSAIASAAVAAFQRGDLAGARQLAEKELGEIGDSPFLQHLIGLVECRLGRFESGIDWLRRASVAEPQNIAYRTMLARALIDAGHAEKALSVAKAPGNSHLDIALWQTCAEAAHRCGRSDVAAEAWRHITELNPADPVAWINLGRARLAQDLFTSAEAAYRRALALQPGNVEAISELGLILERTNQIDALAMLLDRALQQGIGRAQLTELWAVRELRSGRPDEALELLRKEPGADEVRWNRRRAKAADASGKADEAFAASEAMNRATADFDEWRRRASDYRAEILRDAGTIASEWASRLPRPPTAQRRPIFLLGFPRSGTTLLDTFLMGHSDVEVVEEKGLLGRMAKAAGPLESLSQLGPDRLIQLREAYLTEMDRHAAAARVVIDKAPLNMLHAPLIHLLFEGAPILFVKRHPCDAVLSGFMQSFVSNIGMASFLTIEDAADFYDSSMKLWSAAHETLRLNVHIVAYEDIARNPESVLRGVVDFLDIGWDSRMLDHRLTAANRGVVPNTSYDQVVEPLTTAPIGRWRRYKAQLEPVLPLLLGWAERLGYRNES